MTLLLPTDGCPSCITASKGAPVHPSQVLPLPGGQSLRAWYTCPRCGYSWRTNWGIDAASLPCPGCELCAAESGAA